MLTEWQQYVEKKKKYGFSVGCYNATGGKYTSLHCMNCDAVIEVPFEVSEAKHTAGTGKDAKPDAKKAWEDNNKHAKTTKNRQYNSTKPDTNSTRVPTKISLKLTVKAWLGFGRTW